LTLTFRRNLQHRPRGGRRRPIADLADRLGADDDNGATARAFVANHPAAADPRRDEPLDKAIPALRIF
jgi:hypothetical protein